jgi:glutamyl-tRNA synthetase
MSKNDILVRFAPSPTGNLHVGGARTAIFNWLFAKNQGGKFFLRIEDTDRERSKSEYIDDILAGLKYLGLDWEADVWFQSQRIDIHRKAVDKLLRENKAYRCFCLPEKHNLQCRNKSPGEISARLETGERFAVRFKVEGDKVAFQDGVHGKIEYDCADIEDFVILRSDGNPTYMLSVVVDDMDMGITNVIRGDDHISNTPKQILLHRALGNEPPSFAHVPLILGADKKRLSKRHGATSVKDYHRRGILGSTLRNYLALLGWSPGEDREILGLQEMIDLFDLEDINDRSAVFDLAKLEWMNGKYLSALDDTTLTSEVLEWLKEFGNEMEIKIDDITYLKKVLDLAKTRMKFLADIFTQDKYYFLDPKEFDIKGREKYFDLENIGNKLSVICIDLSALEKWRVDEIEKSIRTRAEEWNISAGKIIGALRLCLTGTTISPGLFELMEVLGKDRVIRRINFAIKYLTK